MVFHCSCFFPFQEEIKDETRTQTNTSSTETFYSAYCDLSSAILDAHLDSSKPNNLRVFKLVELKVATSNFCSSSKIGESEFGSTYRGVVKSLEYPFEEIQLAVKHDNKRLLLRQDEWIATVKYLGEVKHPNLVKLVGYCVDDEERLLVYGYVPRRSINDLLRWETPLSWTTRLKLAQDAARALAYLHEGMKFPINYGDFKSTNVLLDDQWNAKITDYGVSLLRPQRFTHAPTGITMGYGALEYVIADQILAKCDVWCYGVFLYELVTGRPPLEKNRPEKLQELLDWVKPYLGSKSLRLIIDPRIEGNYSLKSAQKLSMIANKCVSKNQKSRPKMSEVLEMVNQLTGSITSNQSTISYESGPSA